MASDDADSKFSTFQSDRQDVETIEPKREDSERKLLENFRETAKQEFVVEEHPSEPLPHQFRWQLQDAVARIYHVEIGSDDEAPQPALTR